MRQRAALLLLVAASLSGALLLLRTETGSTGAVAKPDRPARPTAAPREETELKSPPAAGGVPGTQPTGTAGDPEARGSGPSPAAGTGRTAVPPRPVVLFEHASHAASFPGRRWELGPGLTNAGAAFDDDAASCVEVPDGLRAILHADPDGGGPCVLLTAGTHNLAPYGFNDVVSSVRVAAADERIDVPTGSEAEARLFADWPDSGRAWPLRVPAGRAEKLFVATTDFDAGTASAAWVPAGHELTLFEQPDGRGQALVLGPGFHLLVQMGWNDRASSARLRRPER